MPFILFQRNPTILVVPFRLKNAISSGKMVPDPVLVCGFQQFVWSEFSEEYKTTKRRETFYPSVVLADRLYELKITDLPMIPYFPVSSHLEWADFRYYGLRSANAYVLVFDLSNQDTFQVCTHVYVSGCILSFDARIHLFLLRENVTAHGRIICRIRK